MGGSYRECSECGKRALSIATRCPGCGRELEPVEVPETSHSLEFARYLSPGLGGLVALAAIVVAIEMVGDAGQETPTSPPVAPYPAAADSSAEVAYALGATAHLDSASVEATPDEGRLMVARTWANVRADRGRRAKLEAVLTPGDTVFADSLQRDWYRVTFEGEVMGYAHRSTLE